MCPLHDSLYDCGGPARVDTSATCANLDGDRNGNRNTDANKNGNHDADKDRNADGDHDRYKHKSTHQNGNTKTDLENIFSMDKKLKGFRMTDIFETTKDSFIRMGYSPELAEKMAARGGMREASHLVKGEGDPKDDPAAVPDPAVAMQKTIANVKVPGTFNIVDTMPGQDQARSFEDTLTACGMKLNDVKTILASLVNRTTRDQALNTLQTWFLAIGFTGESAARAAAALVGKDEFPNALARQKASGESLDLNHQRPTESLKQSFIGMGYSEIEAERLAAGRDGQYTPLKEIALSHQSEDEKYLRERSRF